MSLLSAVQVLGNLSGTSNPGFKKGYPLQTAESENTCRIGHQLGCRLIMGMCDINLIYECNELDPYVKDFYTAVQR